MPALISLYGWAAREAVIRAARAWPVALATILYFLLTTAARWLVSPLPQIVAGFLVGFVEALCISSYLYLISRAVDARRITLEDLKQSFLALLWDVIGVLFFLWIGGSVIAFIASGAGDHRPFVEAAWGLAVSVLLNPVPEEIYQGRSPGRTTDLMLETVRFVQHYWIEWFVPNLLIGIGLLYFVLGAATFDVKTLTIFLPGLFSLQGAYQVSGLLIQESDGVLWKLPLILALVHLAMVFRGVLFRELITGNWRARAFRARTR